MKSAVAAADGRAELKDVCALRHHDADADGRIALLPHLEVRRIDIAMRDLCDVAQAEDTAIGLDRRFGDGLDAVKRTGHTQRHALRRGFHGTGGHDGILPGERLEDLVGGDAERRQFGIGELDVDLFVLRAVEIDLGDVLDLQQTLAEALGDLLHLGIVGVLGRQHVEDRSRRRHIRRSPTGRSDPTADRP